MNFATSSFFVFLAVALAGYHLLRGRTWKYSFLLAASWFFYAAWDPRFLWVLLLPTAVAWFAGRRIESAATPGRRRLWLSLCLGFNLALLGFFKYTDFFVGTGLSLARTLGYPAPDRSLNILLPLGVSFFTFQGISYALDVYWHKIPAVRSFLDFALFKAFFPQLVAGPIVRAGDFLPQMATPPRVTSAQVVDGLHWFLRGLFKKAFLADQLAAFVDRVFADPAGFDAVTHRWAVLAYAAQIYCDFSGYSDMAVGCARWFGFELPPNFNFPYLAGNITEFWQRWHLTLSTWMRDYVYIPLGGSRKGDGRTCVNLLATLTLCGLWHGASWNYVLWGFYNGVLLVLHRLMTRERRGLSPAGQARRLALRRHPLYRLLAVFCTFMLVALGLVLVRSQTWAGCWLVEASLLGGGAAGTRLVPAGVPLLIGLVAAGHLLSGLRGRLCLLLEMPAILRATAYVAALVLLVVFGPDSTKAFIYFQF